MNNRHTPVMLDESLELLITDKEAVYFEGTAGFGGHTSEILYRIGKSGKLIATDIDKEAFNYLKKKFKSESRLKLYNFNFNQLDIIAKIESEKFFKGIFADLGVSSFQLDEPEAGFTYREDAKLDMRMDKEKVVNAGDVINSFSEEDLSSIFFNYGEERNSKNIARMISRRRTQKKIETTGELSRLIREITPRKYHFKTLSRVFQALRIFVNDELDTLRSFLDKSVNLLEKGGRIVILSYHSLEDGIVKEKFKYENLSCICPKDAPVCTCGKTQRLKILTKKPLTPGDEEVKKNFRSRSAKLRAAEKI
ncbi:MAG TPA: 16S rRNA (cytosine(1402)-N(4))-methyltransferase RsmH [Ignavibacteriaceae bacterium]|nr:16S rRNA (cytosine(1402)-N(4))-methyltransferase RsmH [Ignavibacteriaceae bacterium]